VGGGLGGGGGGGGGATGGVEHLRWVVGGGVFLAAAGWSLGTPRLWGSTGCGLGPLFLHLLSEHQGKIVRGGLVSGGDGVIRRGAAGLLLGESECVGGAGWFFGLLSSVFALSVGVELRAF